MGELLDTIEVENSPVSVGQLGDQPFQIVVGQPLHFVRRRLFIAFGQPVDRSRIVQPPLLTQRFERNVHRDPFHPRPQGTLAAP